MPSRVTPFIAYLGLALLVLGLDQFTKHLAFTHLHAQPPIAILPFLKLVLVFNQGAAFGILSQGSGWQPLFLVALSSGVSLGLIGWLWVARDNSRLAWALALILGGAVGNLIDRVAYAQVIDFISVYYGDWHFPVFNLADSAISIGAVGLILDNFWHPKRRPSD